MRHPFLNNRLLSLYYCLFWLIMATGNVLLQVFWYGADPETALLDTFPVFILFPLLGTSIWYLIRYNDIREGNWPGNLSFHFVAASILNGIWLYLSFILIRSVDPERLSYWYDALPSQLLAGYMMYAVYVVFFYAVCYYHSLREKIKKEGELKTLVRDAELNALKAQINPHFLFNSLNSVASLTISDPEKAREMVISLSALMRYSLHHDRKETVMLEEELDNIKTYLNIEKIRFGDKLNLDIQADEKCLAARIPGMILQPLMENAIKYGVYEASAPVWIRLKCVSADPWFYVSVENDYDPDIIRNKGEGIGLKNIRTRLELIYGIQGQMKITDRGTSFKVELALPK